MSVMEGSFPTALNLKITMEVEARKLPSILPCYCPGKLPCGHLAQMPSGTPPTPI